jgi:hypothetical protein
MGYSPPHFTGEGALLGPGVPACPVPAAVLCAIVAVKNQTYPAQPRPFQTPDGPCGHATICPAGTRHPPDKSTEPTALPSAPHQPPAPCSRATSAPPSYPKPHNVKRPRITTFIAVRHLSSLREGEPRFEPRSPGSFPMNRSYSTVTDLAKLRG